MRSFVKFRWTRRALLFALTPILLLSGCVAYSTSSRPCEPGYGGPPPAYREGRIECVQEIVRRTVGNPAGGAIAGSFIGALVGSAIGGNGASALVGAVGGAATGVAVSQGSSEQREYVVHVRFDDGSLGSVTYPSPPPWHYGDRVRQPPAAWSGIGAAAMPPQPSRLPPPPPSQPPPPPSSPPNEPP